MSVESVNNSSSNAGLYASGAALLGAGAGVATGYLTKPFLKDGAPTDSFIKKMNENLKSVMDPELRTITEAAEKEVNKFQESLMNASSVEDMKKVYLDFNLEQYKNVDIDTAKNTLKFSNTLLDLNEINGLSTEQIAKLDAVTNHDELRAFLSEIFDTEYAGKNVDEIKNSIKKETAEVNRKAAKYTFEMFWDSGKKQFVNCEDGVGAAIKKAAKSIQGKYAVIDGAIGAAVLGLGTLLCCGGKKASEPVEKQVNTQA